MSEIPTTDQMDKITAEERKDLHAYCDKCQEWWRFEYDPTVKPLCPNCNNIPSTKPNFQLITHRTFILKTR